MTIASGKLELVVTNNTPLINAAGGALQSTQLQCMLIIVGNLLDSRSLVIPLLDMSMVFQVVTGTIANTSLEDKDLVFW